MFADNSGGKCINEYEGIEKAKSCTPDQEEELRLAIEAYGCAVREFAELLTPIIEAAAQMLRPIVEIVKQIIPPVCDLVVDTMEQIIELYPNKKVVHLAKHAKKERVRKKNINRIKKWIEEQQKRPRD